MTEKDRWDFGGSNADQKFDLSTYEPGSPTHSIGVQYYPISVQHPSVVDSDLSVSGEVVNFAGPRFDLTRFNTASPLLQRSSPNYPARTLTISVPGIAACALRKPRCHFWWSNAGPRMPARDLTSARTTQLHLCHIISLPCCITSVKHLGVKARRLGHKKGHVLCMVVGCRRMIDLLRNATTGPHDTELSSTIPQSIISPPSEIPISESQKWCFHFLAPND